MTNLPYPAAPRRHSLVWMTWAVFAISFILPSYEETLGYRCALLQLEFWRPALEGEWGPIHYELLTFANLFMLSSPFWYGRACRNSHLWRWAVGGSVVAILLTWGFIGTFLANDSVKVLRVGAFVWCGSFGLLLLSLFAPQARGRPVEMATVSAENHLNPSS